MNTTSLVSSLFPQMVTSRIRALLLLVAVACHVAHVTCDDEWMEEPYGDDNFNTRAEFNSNATLECSDSRTPDGLYLSMPAWFHSESGRPSDNPLKGTNESFHAKKPEGTSVWHYISGGLLHRTLPFVSQMAFRPVSFVPVVLQDGILKPDAPLGISANLKK